MTRHKAAKDQPAAASETRSAGPETIGALLTRLRKGRGLSQLRVAEQLCGLSERPTITRHEVSRWEREERVPGPMWRAWLAAVLDVPLEQLEAAVARTRLLVEPAAIPGVQRAVDQPQLWQVPTVDELLAVLDLGKVDARGMVHAWLAGPMEMPNLDADFRTRPAARSAAEDVQESIGQMETRLGVLRRQDDLVGGRGLAGVVDGELRNAIATLRQVSNGEARHRTLRAVAGYAQLAGWVRADAGQDVAAQRAYRVALHAAAVTGDRDLAGFVLSSLSHLSLGEDAHEALLLARSGYAGVRHGGSPLTRALLLHRAALAAARVGERRTAETALANAERLAGQSEPQGEPVWLYWLDHDELAAMTGRCLAALGRPLRAVRLLSRQRADTGPRTAALYGVCLARSYVHIGEVEQACRVAGRALADAVASGSARAADGIRHLHPMLLLCGRVAAVREYESLVEEIAGRLPGSGPTQGKDGWWGASGSGPARNSGARRHATRSRSSRSAPTNAAPIPRAVPPPAPKQVPGAPARAAMGIRYTRGPGVEVGTSNMNKRA